MIKILDNINVTPILDELSCIQESAWNDAKSWTNPLGKEPVHSIKEQDRLHLVWQTDPDGKNLHWWRDPNWRNDPPTLTCYGRKFPNTISLLENYCSAKNKKIYRIFFSRLTPKAQVYPHVDGQWGENFDNNSRYGLVLTTNQQCKIMCNNKEANPDPGSFFWLENTKIHSAVNNGVTNRIYLYMDTITNLTNNPECAIIQHRLTTQEQK